MIIRIHNTGDPYKLPTLSVHAILLSFSLSFYHLFVSSDEDRPSSSLPACPDNLCQVLLLSLSFSFLFFLTLKKYTPLLLFRSILSQCRCLPYGQMLPHNDLFLHLIPDLSSTSLFLPFSLVLRFSRFCLSRLPRNTTKRVTPRGWETIASPSAHLCTLKRCG